MRAHGGPEVLQSEEIADPQAAPGQVRVRVRACALNHLDLWTRRGLPGRSIVFPHVLGNDIAGEIDDLPAPIEGLSVGQRVMLSPGTSCGRCAMCLSGEDNSCRHYRIFGYSSKNEGTQWGSVPGGVAITATADASTVQVQLGPKCGYEIYLGTELGACVAAGEGVEQGHGESSGW